MLPPNHIATVEVDTFGRAFLVLTPQRYFAQLKRSVSFIPDGLAMAQQLAADFNHGRIWAVPHS